MLTIYTLFFLAFNFSTMVVFDFDKDSDISNWTVVNDVVMGGRSDADFSINKDGHGVFQGHVSLENNGGFASLRYRFQTADVEQYKTIVLKVKGDGKRYQFRVKSEASDYYSYIHYFQTTSDWQTIEIPLAEMYPTFRGRRLDMANFPNKTMGEIAFLIGNKKAENFQLQLDAIQLK